MFLCRRRHKSSSAAAGGAGGGGAGAAGAGPSSAPPPPASSRSSSSRQGQGQGHSHRLGGGRGRRPSPPPPPSTRTVPQARRRPRGSETTHTPTRVSIRREPLTRTTTTASSTTSGTTTSTSTTRHAATRHHGSRSSRRRGHSSQPEDVAEFDSPAAVVVSKSTSPPSSLTTTLVPTYIDGTTEESVPSHNHHVTSNDSNNKAHGTVRVRNATTLSKTQNTSRTTIHTSATTTTDTSAWDIPSHLQQQQPQHDSSLVITEEVAIDGSFRYFQKGRFLGQGGFSNVYECLDKDTGDTFAIKIVPKNKRTLEMLEMEVAIQRSLKHDHICACIRLFQHVHNTFILLEVCDNRSMDRLLQCHTRFPQAQARRFFSQLVQAVAFMQQHCVLHRDLKAANLFLDKNHNVKVGDFGLARQLTHPHEFRTTRCGTPNYMAPEIIRGTRQTRQYSLPVDVWALGIILYLMLAGRLPFEANQDNEETYRRILANQYGFPMRLFHDVSSEAQELIRSILKTNETQRPSASSILRHPFFCK